MKNTEDTAARLANCRLFAGFEAAEVVKLLGCLAPRRTRYARGELVLRPGEPVREFGVVMSGAVCGERTDISGENSVAGMIGEGGVFGEILAIGLNRIHTVTVRAATDTEVLLFGYERVSGICEHACGCHRRLIHNLFSVIGEQYFALADRLYYLSRRTLRQKLTAYLSDCAVRGGGYVFEIPFTREELASYLAADRSALSRELAAMRRDGLVDFSGRSFRLPPAARRE